MALEFHITQPFKLKKPVLIEGFPGIGLVGTISASHLVEKLKMELAGYITSDNFPPIAAVHGYTPLYPARIYVSKKHNLIVLISEFIVPLGAIYELAAKIHSFAKETGARQIISLGAIPLRADGPDMVFAVASNAKLLAELERHHQVKLIKEGATTGVTGILLAQGAIEGYPVVSLLSQAHEQTMDPQAASVVLGVLKSYLSLDFDTSSLLDEAKEMEVKMKDILSKSKAAHTQYKKTAEAGGTDLGPMYG